MNDDSKLDSPLLTSRFVVVLTGLAYIFVAMSFNYLDRSYLPLLPWNVAWAVWGFLGFSVGIVGLGREVSDRRRAWWLTMAFVGAVFGGLVVFSGLNLLRLTSSLLLIVIAARAAVMRTDRDFYLTMVVLVAVSFVICTHGRADWTLWFYLGPAWCAMALAFAWHHASSVRIQPWAKSLLALAFMFTSVLIAFFLFLFLPRPPTLGFGFLPPGTMDAGLRKHEVGAGGQLLRPGHPNQKDSELSGAQQSAAPNGQGGDGRLSLLGFSEFGKNWQVMMTEMRTMLQDRTIPEWQRNVISKLLDWGQRMLDALRGSGEQQAQGKEQAQEPKLQMHFDPIQALWVALFLLVALLAWSRRWRWGQSACLVLAKALASQQPRRSMILSATAMKWCLHEKRHMREPGQSVREHWGSATKMAPLAHKWMGYAVHLYCAVRFGNAKVDRKMALRMHTAVQGAADILHGEMVELQK